MSKNDKDKRVDEIKLGLTPKQWAIALINEMRQRCSEAEFEKALANEAQTYRELPYVEAFFVLSEQAKKSHPGESPQDIDERLQLARRLRKEFHFLKIFIFTVNGCVKDKFSVLEMKTTFKLSELEGMISRDALGQRDRRIASWIKRHMAADQERREILDELAACTNYLAGNSDNSSLSTSVHLQIHSLVETWADDVAMLLMEAFEHKTAIHTIQEKYFDGHSILWRDIEATLERTIQAVRDAVALYDEYLKKSTAKRKRDLTIDLEAIQDRARLLANVIVRQWVEHANDRATSDILQVSGDHEEFILQRLRERAGLTSRGRSQTASSSPL